MTSKLLQSRLLKLQPHLTKRFHNDMFLVTLMAVMLCLMTPSIQEKQVLVPYTNVWDAPNYAGN